MHNSSNTTWNRLPHLLVVGVGLLLSLLLAELMFAEDCPPENLYQAATCEEVERSGHPWCRRLWAKPQNACDYTGYYVGGGAPGYKGRDHCSSEGTWGWDYSGKWFHRCVRLSWFCKPRYQGGQGQYQPDGPRVLEAISEAHAHQGESSKCR